MKKISVALVDDESLIVSLLNDFLQRQEEIEVCFTATSGEEFLEQLFNSDQYPTVVILDLKMKGKSGIDILKILRDNYPGIKAVILSSYYKLSFIGFMLKSGVSAFLPKGISPQQLLMVIQEVNQRGFFFLAEQLETIRTQVATNSPYPETIKQDKLTDREVEVLKLLCYQKTAKEIGEQLFIASRTVEGHKNNLLMKTDTKNIAGLVIYAIQNNYINIDQIPLSILK